MTTPVASSVPASDAVPCVVTYAPGPNRVATIWHPSRDANHPNVVACRARLERKHWRVEFTMTPPPLSVGKPTTAKPTARYHPRSSR